MFPRRLLQFPALEICSSGCPSPAPSQIRLHTNFRSTNFRRQESLDEFCCVKNPLEEISEQQLILDTRLALSDFRSLREELVSVASSCREALETRGTNAELYAKYSLASEANDALIVQNNQLKTELLSTREELDELSRSLAEDKRKLEESIIATRAISDRNYFLEAEKAKAEEHILALLSEVAGAKTRITELTHDLEIAKTRGQISDLSDSAAISDLRRSISDFRTSEIEKNRSLASAEKRAAAAEREAASLRSEISTLRKSQEISEREISELRALLEKQNGIIKNLEISNENFKTQISALKTENESLAGKLESASVSLAKKSSEAEEFRVALEEEQRSRDEAIARISVRSKDVEHSVIQRYEVRLQEISVHNDDLIRETAEAKARADSLSRELEATQRRSEILLAGLKKENQRLVYEVESATIGKSSLRNSLCSVLKLFVCHQSSSPHSNYFLTLTTKQHNSPFVLTDEDDPEIFGSVTFTPPIIGASPARKTNPQITQPRPGSVVSSPSPSSASSASRRRFSLPSKLPPASPLQAKQQTQNPVSSISAVVAAKRLARRARKNLQDSETGNLSPARESFPESSVARQSFLAPIPEEEGEGELARAVRLRQRFASRRFAARQRLASASASSTQDEEEEEEVSTLHSEDDVCPEISAKDVIESLWRSRNEAEAVLDRGFWQSEKASRVARLQAWEILQAARTDAIRILGLPEDSELPQPPVWAFLGLEADDFHVDSDSSFAAAPEESEAQDALGGSSAEEANVPGNFAAAGATPAGTGAGAAAEMPELSRCGKFLRCLFRTVPLLARLGAPLVPGGTGVVVAVDAVAEEGSRGFVYLELQQGLNRLVKLLDDVRFVFNTAKLSDEEFKQLLINNLIHPLGKLLLHFDLSVSVSKGVKLSTVEKMLDIKALRKVKKQLLSLVEAELVITSQHWSQIYRKTHITFNRILDLIKDALEQHPVGGCFGGCCLSVVSRRRRPHPPAPLAAPASPAAPAAPEAPAAPAEAAVNTDSSH